MADRLAHIPSQAQAKESGRQGSIRRDNAAVVGSLDGITARVHQEALQFLRHEELSHKYTLDSGGFFPF